MMNGRRVRSQWLRGLAGIVWGFLLFLGIAWSLRFGLGSSLTGAAVLSQIVLKTVLVIVALVAWKLLGKPYGAMGWRWADWWNRSYVVWFAIGAVAMMAASVVMIFLGLRHPLAAQMSFLQIVLVVWLVSSLSEEVYVRGLVQSWIADRDQAYGTSSPFEPAIVSSTLLFAALHVPLMWTPIGIIGGLPIVLATLGVGFACAVLRARTGSLWPAIACHVVGNVAAIPGGILGVILYRLVYGRLPEMLGSG
jgi:membrane protease YdiL (CAAX protease family)